MQTESAWDVSWQRDYWEPCSSFFVVSWSAGLPDGRMETFLVAPWTMEVPMRKWSFSGVHQLPDDSKLTLAFQKWKKQGVNPEIRSRKQALIWLSSMSGSHWWYLFYKEVESWNCTTSFRIWQFQTPDFKVVASNTSPGWTIRFLWVGDRSFLKKGCQDLSDGTNVAS